METENFEQEDVKMELTHGEEPTFSDYEVLTEIVHEGRIWKQGETVSLPVMTGEGLTESGDVKPH